MTFMRPKTVRGENSILRTKPIGRPWVALRSIAYATLFLALWTFAALVCRPLDKLIPPRIPDGLVTPGVVLVLAGIGLVLTAVTSFIFRGRGTPAIFDPPQKFVPYGPYRFVRNPMYWGYVIMLLGLGLCLPSVSIVLFAMVAFLSIHTFVVLAEEPGLRKRFGQEYEDYCRTVPRWIPCFSRQRLRA